MSFEGMGAALDSAADTCGFRVWAPNASNLHVTGTLGEWSENEHPLADEGSGYRAATTRGVRGGEPYRFVIQTGSQHWRVHAYPHDMAPGDTAPGDTAAGDTVENGVRDIGGREHLARNHEQPGARVRRP